MRPPDAPALARRASQASLGVLLLLLAASACGDDGGLPPPEHLPYRFEPVLKFNAHPTFADLDGDGRDEILQVFEPSGRRSETLMAVMIETHEGLAVDQLNYVGFVGTPHALDLDDDGRSEILVPVTRNDTLFLSVADAAGNKLFGFPLTTGRPRVEPEGELPWDPEVLGFHLLDLRGDPAPELVSVVSTGFARHPRGVFIHTLPGGQLMDSLTLGAGLSNQTLTRLETGDPVLVFSTYASDNGASAGGFDDRHAYAIVMDLVPSLGVRWSRELGEVGAQVRTSLADVTGDGRRELVIVSTDSDRSRVELVDPATGAAFASREHRPLRRPVVGDWDGDGTAEIVGVVGRSTVVEVGSDLEVDRRARLPLSVWQAFRWPDLDGDGLDEITVFSVSRRMHVLLDAELRPRAYFSGSGRPRLFRRGAQARPLLVRSMNGEYQGLELVRNRWYLAHRFGPTAVAAVGPLVLLVLLVASVRARRRSRIQRAVVTTRLGGDGSGLLVLERAGRIVWAAGNLPRLQNGGEEPAPPRSVDDLRLSAPALADLCRRIVESDVLEPVDARLEFDEDGRRGPLHVTARPVRLGTRGDPHWILRCRLGPLGLDPEQSATWALLARRVAHDIKNPLSGILLTLDRMRRAVLDQAPEAAEALSSHANRIEERIEQLRRMTSNFLKFVDVEEANRRLLDLGEVVRNSMISASQTVPDDIEIRLKLREDPIPVSLDREQFHSVVENLVANAVNAMQEGGTLVVRTDLARSLLLSPEQGPRDYGVLEIRDTGAGIPDELLSRLFDPGFSTADGGTGLGLAIVRKIVEDHGGDVSVESEVEVGSVFSVYVPLRRDEGSPADEA